MKTLKGRESEKLISFDYAIKYLLKHKRDYEIIEGFVSAILKAQGHDSIKICGLLDPETNREDSALKRSIADLLVEDKQGRRYLVEIERAPTENLIHKACFNKSRLIVDSVGQGMSYLSIQKVFHISLVFFVPHPSVKRMMYHGKTVFRSVPEEEPLDLQLIDADGNTFNISALPEYILISVPLFNDQIREDLDEWLYLLKHSQVRSSFQAPGMNKVQDRLALLHMTPKERENYYTYMTQIVEEEDHLRCAANKGKAEGLAEGLQKGKAEGLAEGLEKGRLESQKEIAKNLLNLGISLEKVHQATGVSLEELSGLASLV